MTAQPHLRHSGAKGLVYQSRHSGAKGLVYQARHSGGKGLVYQARHSDESRNPVRPLHTRHPQSSSWIPAPMRLRGAQSATYGAGMTL